MGNCIRHESSMTWAGDDWGSPLSSERLHKKSRTHEWLFDKADDQRTTTTKMEKERLLGEKIIGVSSSSSSSSSSTTTEVKIKISKKQLEDLLGKVDVQGLSVDQVMDQLMNVSGRFETQHRSWRPALQSIPEVN